MKTLDTASWGAELIAAQMDTGPWTAVSLVGDGVPWTQLLPVPQTALDVYFWPLGMISGMVFQNQELPDDELTTNPWTEL